MLYDMEVLLSKERVREQRPPLWQTEDRAFFLSGVPLLLDVDSRVGYMFEHHGLRCTDASELTIDVYRYHAVNES